MTDRELQSLFSAIRETAAVAKSLLEREGPDRKRKWSVRISYDELFGTLCRINFLAGQAAEKLGPSMDDVIEEDSQYQARLQMDREEETRPPDARPN